MGVGPLWSSVVEGFVLCCAVDVFAAAVVVVAAAAAVVGATRRVGNRMLVSRGGDGIKLFFFCLGVVYIRETMAIMYL